MCVAAHRPSDTDTRLHRFPASKEVPQTGRCEASGSHLEPSVLDVEGDVDGLVGVCGAWEEGSAN